MASFDDKTKAEIIADMRFVRESCRTVKELLTTVDLPEIDMAEIGDTILVQIDAICMQLDQIEDEATRMGKTEEMRRSIDMLKNSLQKTCDHLKSQLP